MLGVSNDGGVIPLSPASASDSNLKKGSPLVYVPGSDILLITRIDAIFGDPDVVVQSSADGGTNGNGVYQDMLWGCTKDSIVAFFWRDRISYDGGYTFGGNFRVSGSSSLYM